MKTLVIRQPWATLMANGIKALSVGIIWVDNSEYKKNSDYIGVDYMNIAKYMESLVI